MKTMAEPTRLAGLLLRLSSLPFLGIGVAFLCAPAAMGALVGVALADATADNDVRSVYGGLQLACGALLFIAPSRQEWIRPGLIAQIVLFSGLAAGRFTSFAWVGLPGGLALGLHAAELGAIAAGVVCLLRLRPLPEASSPGR